MKSKFFALVAAALMAGSAIAAPSKNHTSGRTESRMGNWYNSRPGIGESRLNLGVHFGAAFNSISLDSSARQVPDTSGATGITGGITTEIGVASWFAVQPEINYIRRSGEVIYGQAQGLGANQNVYGKYNFDYLEIPLFAKFRYEVLDNFRPFIMTGPSIGFLIGRSGTLNQNGRTTTIPSTDLNNNYQTVNMSWNFGLGADYDITKQWAIVLDSRFGIGMTNILTNRGQGPDRDASTSLNAFQVLGGVKMSML